MDVIAAGYDWCEDDVCSSWTVTNWLTLSHRLLHLKLLRRRRHRRRHHLPATEVVITKIQKEAGDPRIRYNAKTTTRSLVSTRWNFTYLVFLVIIVICASTTSSSVRWQELRHTREFVLVFVIVLTTSCS